MKNSGMTRYILAQAMLIMAISFNPQILNGKEKKKRRLLKKKQNVQINRKKLNRAAKNKLTYILSFFLPETLRVIMSTCHVGSARILRLIPHLLLLHHQQFRHFPSTHLTTPS